jgi:hypothetical protein
MWNGDKSFDIRKNDREYQKGKLLWQREYDPATGYSGREMVQYTTYILPSGVYDGLQEGYCCMGIIVVQRHEAGSTVPLLDVRTHE